MLILESPIGLLEEIVELHPKQKHRAHKSLLEPIHYKQILNYLKLIVFSNNLTDTPRCSVASAGADTKNFDVIIILILI